MKRLPLRPRRPVPTAFTLVELLVVIAIIAILAAAVLGVSGVVINSAKRAKAANTATQLQTAALSYYTEYSIYPDDTTAFPSGTDYLISDTDAANWKNLIIALSGNINPATGVTATSTVPNTRGIAFLTLKASDLYSTTVIAPKNPLPPDTTHLYFNFAVDNDYNGVLGVAASSAVTTMPNFAATPFNAAAIAGGGTSTAGVAVWANCSGSASVTNSAYWVHTF